MPRRMRAGAFRGLSFFRREGLEGGWNLLRAWAVSRVRDLSRIGELSPAVSVCRVSLPAYRVGGSACRAGVLLVAALRTKFAELRFLYYFCSLAAARRAGCGEGCLSGFRRSGGRGPKEPMTAGSRQPDGTARTGRSKRRGLWIKSSCSTTNITDRSGR